MKSRTILIVAGEPSGDLHAAHLVRELRAQDPSLSFVGMAGPLCKKEGVEVVFDISALALVGLVEVIKNIGVVSMARDAVYRAIDARHVDAAILVDYPGFNLRLAKALKKRAIPVIYYISPQVWAWGAGRIKRIRECVRKMAVFFRFEEELYKRHNVSVEWVGHPLIDIVRPSLSKDEIRRRYNLSSGKKTIALLPGSRLLEAKNLLSPMLDGARLIAYKLGGAQCIIAKHPSLPGELFAEKARDAGLDIRIAEGDTYNVLHVADFAVIASGTATLEAAILETPFVLVYKAHLFTWLAYRIVSRIPYLGLVNIIAGKSVTPEFIQRRVTPDNIARSALDILTSDSRRNSLLKELRAVKSALGPPGAARRAALAVLDALRPLQT